MNARLRLVFILLILCVPIVTAHIQNSRPIFQRVERDRIVGLEPGALGVGADLSLLGDPLRQFVAHTVDPTRGLVSVAYRADASVVKDQFFAQWRFERLLEYRDMNVNGHFEPKTDVALKVWRFQHYQWQRQPIQQAEVGGVQGKDITWEGNLTGSPHVRAETFIAGKPFIDEGANVRPQDIILYLDFKDLPSRSIGGLYALEATVTVQADTTLSLHESQNESTALLAITPQARALLVWGGEAQLDGREQVVEATIIDERIMDDGNKTATLLIHIPTVDREMRFVFVSGVEYGTENLRTPGIAPAFAALLVGLLALTRPRSRR